MAKFVAGTVPGLPDLAVVLGSGLGKITHDLENEVCVPYDSIQGYPKSTVEGHAGQFIAGDLEGTAVLLASGRFHLYEGYDYDTVTLPVRLFHSLGIKTLIITNAAGSVRKQMPPGTLMMITGHIDCTFLESANMPEVVRDSKFHPPSLATQVRETVENLNFPLAEGVYAWTLGPSYETPAEIEMIRDLGGDAVGMSTVPEIRAAGEFGMNVLGISCITNYAAGITKEPLTHKEVLETTEKASEKFIALIKGIIKQIGEKTVE